LCKSDGSIFRLRVSTRREKLIRVRRTNYSHSRWHTIRPSRICGTPMKTSWRAC
jgi:hypothetical protein